MWDIVKSKNGLQSVCKSHYPFGCWAEYSEASKGYYSELKVYNSQVVSNALERLTEMIEQEIKVQQIHKKSLQKKI